ncbi:hypothetical protein GCM10009613_12630 [Pseudonocardia kongjuensis]|uniref:Uncharacterized protein n=1 Tax=Pseudonocardia kongjuensis TaxID=102227 RepID=A0ABP4IAT3_9PSEU
MAAASSRHRPSRRSAADTTSRTVTTGGGTVGYSADPAGAVGPVGAVGTGDTVADAREPAPAVAGSRCRRSVTRVPDLSGSRQSWPGADAGTI